MVRRAWRTTLTSSRLIALLLLLPLLTSLVHAAPPNRVSVAGLGNLVTEIAAPGGSGITALSPAGDVDGDGLADIIVRFASAESNPPIFYDDVVLLYGFAPPGGSLQAL